MIHRRAFSLVELSIVLVILGLLVGGVLSGQSLMRAAQLRKVITQKDSYISAIYAFKDKYFGLPGDLTNATQFWGRKAAAGYCPTNVGAAVNATSGTCDGDGNGQILYTPVPNEEFLHFWEQLSRAGLIEGNYSYTHPGLGEAAGTGIETPPLQGMTGTVYAGYVTFHGVQTNYIIFGAVSGFSTGLVRGIMKPEEAWNLDTKADDGVGGSGMMTGHYDASDPVASDPTNRCVNLWSSPTSAYQIGNSAVTCYLQFKIK